LLRSWLPDSDGGEALRPRQRKITLSIYAHVLEADELAAAKLQDDAMIEVIGSAKRQPKRLKLRK
jgi:hypothetical protein